MSDAVADEQLPAKRGRSKLLLAGVVLIAGLGGFAASYLGFVSPSALLASEEKAEAHGPLPGYVDVPRIMLPLAGRNRQLVLSIKLETTADHVAGITQQLPRILDSFNSFLSDIDPAAFDRRGVLEIVRAELQTRVDMLLGEPRVGNVLITEFAIQ